MYGSKYGRVCFGSYSFFSKIMYHGLLVYNKADVDRNSWFISELTGRSRDFGIELSLFTGDLDSAFSDLLKDIDIVLNRSRDIRVNLLCRECGVICMNNEPTVRLGNNKWENYLFCVENDIPVIDTMPVKEGGPLPEFPFVMKEISGHGGHEVYWIDTIEKYERLLSRPGKSYIAQRAVSDHTSDLRLYMMGDRIIAGIMRESTIDFRSNYSNGGSIRLFEPDSGVTEIARKVQRLLDCDFIGIDFIPDKGKWYLNEIEDAVGSRMVYQLTDIDVVSLYLERARRNLNEQDNHYRA